MSETPLQHPVRARVAHTAPGRLRVRVNAPRGQGKLRQVAEELRRLPETETVRANHTARSVTVTYDPYRVSFASLLERLQELGLIALDLTDPMEWGELLAENVVPRAEDPASLPGRINHGLRQLTNGTLDLPRLTAAVLLVTAGLQVRAALLQGSTIPWVRVLTYLLAALTIGSRRPETTRWAILTDAQR